MAPKMNFNLSASLNIFKLIANPSLCLPHYTVSTFAQLPIPLDAPLKAVGHKADIRAVILDKDDCFAIPDTYSVYPPYTAHMDRLRLAYPGRKLLIISNTAGATSYDSTLHLSATVEKETGIPVLPHATKKPGCTEEIMEYFTTHPETGVTHPSQIAVVGDRLTTDMMLANKLGGWGFWFHDGVVSMEKKSFFSRTERLVYNFFTKRGFAAPTPASPSE